MSIPPICSALRKKRILIFITVLAVMVVFYFADLSRLLRFSLHDETWSHIPLIPLVSAWFFFQVRKDIDGRIHYSIVFGLIAIVIGITLHCIGVTIRNIMVDSNYLSLTMVSFLLSFFGVFILCFGTDAFKHALFPLLFLLFMIPLPSFIERLLVEIFRFGSAEMANVYFSVVGIPFVREGSTFHLQNLSIDVADQCSGIHSGISLFIVGTIAVKLFLRTQTARLLVLLAIVPIGWIKNGMRIATLALLGNYVNIGFLHGPLHRQGGRPFFVIGLLLLGVVLYLFRAIEKKLWRSPRES